MHTAVVYVIQVWCVYSERTPGGGQRNCLKHVEFYSKNKFEKLVHLVGFIIICDNTFMMHINSLPKHVGGSYLP